MENSIEYYTRRLKLIQNLFITHETKLLQENADKIEALVEGYNQFKNDPDYDAGLAEFPQVFIFN